MDALEFLLTLAAHFYMPVDRTSGVFLTSSIYRIFDVTSVARKAVSILRRVRTLPLWRDRIAYSFSSYLNANLVKCAGIEKGKCLAALCVVGGGALAGSSYHTPYFKYPSTADPPDQRIDVISLNAMEMLSYKKSWSYITFLLSNLSSDQLPYDLVIMTSFVPADDFYLENLKKEKQKNNEKGKTQGDLQILRGSSASVGKSIRESVCCDSDDIQTHIPFLLDSLNSLVKLCDVEEMSMTPDDG